MTLPMKPVFEALKCDAAADQFSVAFAFETLANRMFSKIACGSQIRCDPTHGTTEQQHTSAAAALRPIFRSQRRKIKCRRLKWASPSESVCGRSRGGRAEVARRFLGGSSEVPRRFLGPSDEKVVAFEGPRRFLGGSSEVARRLRGGCAKVARSHRKCPRVARAKSFRATSTIFPRKNPRLPKLS